MNELKIIKWNGGAYIDSREVAEIIGKSHKNLLRDIRGYEEILAKRGRLNFEPSDFFVESSFINAQNKVMPCYLITRKGADIIANKLNGEKGVLFTAAYVTRFHQLDAAERERLITAQNKPSLSEFNSAVRNVLAGMSYTYAEPDKVMSFLRGVYQPLGIKFTADENEGTYLSATQIARSIGLYSYTGRPHAHAIAAIIEKLDMPVAKHIIAVPYGLIGVAFRYDLHVLIEVCQWLIDNHCPVTIPHLGFEYHVYYHATTECDDDFDGYTDDELDAMCGKFGDCDECPGRADCCN